MSDPGDYEVGYGKPPVQTRFGGARGNGRGRGRKSRNLKTDLMEELAYIIEVKSNGKLVKLSQQRAMVKALMVGGIKGDVRAISKAFDLLLKVIGADDGSAPAQDLTSEDQAILDEYLKRERNDGEA